MGFETVPGFSGVSRFVPLDGRLQSGMGGAQQANFGEGAGIQAWGRDGHCSSRHSWLSSLHHNPFLNFLFGFFELSFCFFFEICTGVFDFFVVLFFALFCDFTIHFFILFCTLFFCMYFVTFIFCAIF